MKSFYRLHPSRNAKHSNKRKKIKRVYMSMKESEKKSECGCKKEAKDQQYLSGSNFYKEETANIAPTMSPKPPHRNK